MKTYYMHTINGKPAFWSENDGQICYMNVYGKASLLSESLRQIRLEQKATIAYRKACGMPEDENDKYGYRRVAT